MGLRGVLRMRFRVGYGWGFDVVMVGLEWG